MIIATMRDAGNNVDRDDVENDGLRKSEEIRPYRVDHTLLYLPVT